MDRELEEAATMMASTMVVVVRDTDRYEVEHQATVAQRTRLRCPKAKAMKCKTYSCTYIS
jgi:hypothetical protein